MRSLPTSDERKDVSRKRNLARLTTAAAGVFMVTSGWYLWRPYWPAGQLLRQETARQTFLPPAIVPTPASPQRTDASALPAPLPLLLTATRLGRSPREGSADIGVDAKTPQTYAVGAILANGSRLTEIYRDFVVLTRDGLSVRLYQSSGRGIVGTTSLSPLAIVGGNALPARATVDSSEPILDYIRVTPLYDGSTLRGYQVYAGSEPASFAKMGFQPGDVITSINGARVSDPEIVIPQLRTLATGGALTVMVERNTGVTMLTLDGRIIAEALRQKEQDAMVAAISNTNP